MDALYHHEILGLKLKNKSEKGNEETSNAHRILKKEKKRVKDF